jgi:hypothetical protein
MHFGGNLGYQFAAAPSREMMRDLARVASSPLAEEFARVRVAVVFRRRCGSVVGRPWCEL